MIIKKIGIISLFLFTVNVSALDIFDAINKNNCDQVIDKQVYNICYSYRYKGALAVGYKLNGSLVNKKNIKKRPSFYSEKTIPNKYRSKSSDYIHTGYDRGHLANDASFDYNKKVQRKTYSMANIVPQAPKVNRKTWIKAEKYERKAAFKLGSVSVLNLVTYSNNPKIIGKNKISVPNGFYKIIWNDHKNFKKCFYYKNVKNVDVKKDKLKNHLIVCPI